MEQKTAPARRNIPRSATRNFRKFRTDFCAEIGAGPPLSQQSDPARQPLQRHRHHAPAHQVTDQPR
jgi:hypothetical protein